MEGGLLRGNGVRRLWRGVCGEGRVIERDGEGTRKSVKGEGKVQGFSDLQINYSISSKLYQPKFSIEYFMFLTSTFLFRRNSTASKKKTMLQS